MAAAKKTKTANATETKPRKKRVYRKREKVAPKAEEFDVLSLRLPVSVKAKFQEACAKDHRTMSQQVAFMVDNYTNGNESRA